MGKVVVEIINDGEQIVFCKGGNGGWGNMYFKIFINCVLKWVNVGQLGEVGVFCFVLKSIVDIGFVGFLNVGKFLFIMKIIKVWLKIVVYFFMMFYLQIGVIEYFKKYDCLFIVDVFGLIEGVSENCGFGYCFLCYIECCVLFMFFIDMVGVDNCDLCDDYVMFVKELKFYDFVFLKKFCVVVVNKMGFEGVKENFVKFSCCYKVDVFQIFCFSGIGFEKFKDEFCCCVWKICFVVVKFLSVDF